MRIFRAALFIVSLGAALTYTELQSTCRNLVECPCGNTNKNFTICIEETNAENDLCSRWSGCLACQDGLNRCVECPLGFEGPLCTEKTGAKQEAKSRTKRQFFDNRHMNPAVQSGPVYQYYPVRSSRTGGACPDLNSPKLGSIRCTYNSRQRSCTGKCLPGYNFENMESVTDIELQCIDGTWTPLREFPPCKSGGHCDLVVHGGGSFNCTTGMEGTFCDVRCANYYPGRYYCYPGRQWEPPLPRCVVPKGITGGEGTTPSCHCQYGGSCDRNGRCVCPVGRTGTYCEMIVPEKETCEDPGFIHNGYRRNMDGTESTSQRIFEEGESVVFACRPPDFALQGSSILTCQADSTWSEPLPKCIKPTASEVMCPDPGQVANADRLNSDGSPSTGNQRYDVGQSVVYTCHEGFALQRRSLITCLPTGRWSSNIPYCRAIGSQTPRPNTAGGQMSFCRDPGTNPNGNRSPAVAPTSRGFPQGSSLEYSCNDNYDLDGERQIFCLISGKWSSSIPRCVEKSDPRVSTSELPYCDNPGPVSNGRIVIHRSITARVRNPPTLNDPEYPQGTRLQYSCHNGYTLQGSASLTCEASGLWSGDAPICKRDATAELDYCDNPGPVSNGRIVIHRSITARVRNPPTLNDPEYPQGTRLQYSCDNGYTLEGSASLTCEASGLWSGDAPICKRGTVSNNLKYCRRPEPIANGEIIFNPTLDVRRRPQSELEDEEYPEGSRMLYTCNTGYTLEGTEILTCQSSGMWSANAPSCIRVSSRNTVFCENPGPIFDGSFKVRPPQNGPRSASRSFTDDDHEYPEGTRLEYSCEEGYVLQGAVELRCDSNGLWTSDAPSCITECGHSFMQTTRKVIHGKKTTAGEWPWVVAISVQEGNISRIICGGTVINSRAVVTAAHCLTMHNTFTVYFGKFHLLDKDDDSEVLIRRTNRFTLHPNFRNSTYDSDIGLLIFSPRINFSDRIQPICLPTAQTTAQNLMTGKRGYVTGWGLTERNLQADELLLVRLPILTNNACQESYRAQNLSLPLTQNMFCAGFENGQQSTCRGDSGSPMVFYDRQTDRHTLEGIVSFGVQGQCGLPGRYSVFTRVIRFLRWIRDNGP